MATEQHLHTISFLALICVVSNGRGRQQEQKGSEFRLNYIQKSNEPQIMCMHKVSWICQEQADPFSRWVLNYELCFHSVNILLNEVFWRLKRFGELPVPQATQTRCITQQQGEWRPKQVVEDVTTFEVPPVTSYCAVQSLQESYVTIKIEEVTAKWTNPEKLVAWPKEC